MKLIVIYGPPAAGKLTVARELEHIVEARVFHNHHTIDLALDVMTKEQADRSRLVSRLRRTVFEAAVTADASIIFTVVYEHEVDDDYIQNLIEPVVEGGGEVLFVQLSPRRSELDKRVAAPSRRDFTKIQDVKVLADVLGGHELSREMTGRETLRIDNTELSPADTARLIKKHYQL
jgi:chloramphenicol 3-O-phosphotransferase